jgi:hypothetical protein
MASGSRQFSAPCSCEAGGHIFIHLISVLFQRWNSASHSEITWPRLETWAEVRVMSVLHCITDCQGQACMNSLFNHLSYEL